MGDAELDLGLVSVKLDLDSTLVGLLASPSNSILQGHHEDDVKNLFIFPRCKDWF